jgi:hypothetical protein
VKNGYNQIWAPTGERDKEVNQIWDGGGEGRPMETVPTKQVSRPEREREREKMIPMLIFVFKEENEKKKKKKKKKKNHVTVDVEEM